MAQWQPSRQIGQILTIQNIQHVTEVLLKWLDCAARIMASFLSMESTATAWASWISFAVIILAPLVLFVSKNWIIAQITKGVQHDFDVKLEELRATLKTSEEQLKSNLREKEADWYPQKQCSIRKRKSPDAS